MFAFLLVSGGLLCGFGGIALIVSLPVGSRRVSLKEAFSEIFSNKKVQIGLACFITGFLLIQYCFWLAMP